MNKINSRFKALTLSHSQLLFIGCCYIALILNMPFLIKTMTAITEIPDYSVLFLLSVPVFLLSLIIVILGIISINVLIKPILIFSIICGALIFYSILTYGVVFDYGMVQNTIETDSAEALSYLNFYAVFFFLLFGVIPSAAIFAVKIEVKTFQRELLSRIKLLFSSVVVLAIISSAFASNYSSVGRNNAELINYITPFKMYGASYRYVKKNYFYPKLKFQVLDDAPTITSTSNNKHVSVLVLGETARSKNFSLNGYSRPTNQYTQQQGVVSFSQVTSCGTYTAMSVPCMFSRLNKENYDKHTATAQQNVIDLVHLAGADVEWYSNNNGSCKGVCVRVKTKQMNTDKVNELCDGEYCFDEVLLIPLREKLENLTNENTLIVLHLIGSHGPTYFKRYPNEKRIFTPDCQRSDLQHCSDEQLVNAYDNTIAYTDFVLSEIINELENLANTTDGEQVDTSLLYISDHGESLGENGVYLHGLPYTFAPEEQTQIPMLYWENNSQPIFDIDCLTSKKNDPITHDNIFDLVLNMMSVSSTAYDKTNDIFSDCKLPNIIASNT